MNLTAIGHLALTMSFGLYCLYYIPQLWHNRQLPNRENLSWWLHRIYITGLCCDWIYGWGYHLAWQYRTVTLIGLLCLAIQHLQLRPDKGSKQWLCYRRMSWELGLVVLTAMLIGCRVPSLENSMLNLLGITASVCWWAALIPQIYRNYLYRSGIAISSYFIAITMSTACLDWIAAIALHWPWPSLLGPPILISLLATCWLQQLYFKRQRDRPAARSPQPIIANAPNNR